MALARGVARAEALGEQVVAVLRSDILTGDLPPGDLLVEAALAESFGVSRGPVRDALRTLSGEGLIAPSGRSYRVVGLDQQDLRDLFALRELLEVAAAQQCAVSDPDGLRQAAEAALDDMRRADEAGDTDAFARADVAFHSAFFTSCGNRRLLAVWEQQVPTFTELFRLTTALDEPLSRSVEWHRLMLDTVYAGDPDSIAAEVRKLVVGGEEQIIAAQRKLLEQRGAPTSQTARS
ncbi:GntR family transcriptional regulator [Arthrobacter sp. GCM10027362]|uniref:GntR family transcriptional regulator n=1 Tax=Arthrobacter sp. GCM10027362 TaxID=3273379 RepID=UPI003640ACBA